MQSGVQPAAWRRRRFVLVAAILALMALFLLPAAVRAIPPPPSISGIDPTHGPVSAQTTVQIYGANFAGVDSVIFGGRTADQVQFSADNHISARAPKGFVVGPVAVQVHTAGGGWSAPNAIFFNYDTDLGPTVSSVFPPSGPTAGTNTVTVNGANFFGVISVTFGGQQGGLIDVNGDGTQLHVAAPPHAAGTVHVQVNTNSGSSPLTVNDQYTYVIGGAAPVIYSLDPPYGPVGGNTRVLITGTGFLATTAVTFDGTGAAFQINSDNSITTWSPAHAAGTIIVQVLGTNGASAPTLASQFTYTGTAVPFISYISPTYGPVAGSTSVTITGGNFLNATSVAFGITPAAFNIISDNTIIATSPAHSAGTVDIRVSNVYGMSADTVADNFTYTGTLPVVSSVSPPSGPTTGGTTVTILGSGFTSGSEVDFGVTPATNVTFNSSTQLTVTSPAHSAGVVDVTVTTASGTSVTSAGDHFTYTAGSATFTYSLGFRWTLIVWKGINGVTIAAATSGLESPDNAATNNVSTIITVIARWSVPKQNWEYAFPPKISVPGANDFLTLEFDRAYFIAIAGPGDATWTVLQN